MTIPDAGASAPSTKDVLRLALAAVGIVYGDIGTSPLYTLRECLNAAGGTGEAQVLGILSLIFWSLIGVVTLKYVVLAMRWDNRGEGGVLALMALTLEGRDIGARARRLLFALAVIGAALFYGDCILTPAISVLSAVEGLKIATDAFEPFVVPLSLLVLVALFVVQRFGTAGVGSLFGPVTVVWFAALLVLGLIHIAERPDVLQALDPRHAIAFFADNGWVGFAALGSVVLAITGGEALYADMGHFGARPIRWAWFGLVLPALLINYFGQGALVLADPAAVTNPFYLMAPGWALLPMVALATAATVIASQAVISGAFSMAQQATLLGLSPRMRIRHTSHSEIGQIYVPTLNWGLMAGVALLVAGFGSSDRLANAYGIAVTGTMLVTTILAMAAARHLWGWGWGRVALVLGGFLVVDAAFLSANLLKVASGGWIPLLVGALVFATMWTWRRGRAALADQESADSLPTAMFLRRVEPGRPHRVPGTAVFMTARASEIPRALLHNLKHNQILHERVVLASVTTMPVPRVAGAERLSVEDLGKGFLSVSLRFGFMQTPNVPKALARLPKFGHDWDEMRVSYFIGRNSLAAAVKPSLPRWQERLFIALYKLGANAGDFFRIPPGKVVELGTRLEI
ncbi:MAG: potassium transporter Kup [Rhodospirillales bacterium]|nr:potassium transporter Kup [Rhodospirillales bacterium]